MLNWGLALGKCYALTMGSCIGCAYLLGKQILLIWG